MRARLFTNLSYVTVVVDGAERGVRCNCSALLIEAPDPNPAFRGMLSGRWRLRGFGPDGAWPVFDFALSVGDGFAYQREVYESGLKLLRDDGAVKGIGDGAVLRFGDGTRLVLQVEDGEREVAVDDFDDDAEYDAIWRRLGERAREFWTAPNMPTLTWAPPASVLSSVERFR